MWIPISSLFIAPFQEAHGWSRGEIAYVQSVVIFSALIAPFVGRLSDRFGVRIVLLVGIAVMAAGYVGMAMMGDSLYAFFAIFTVFALAGISTTGLTFTRIISHAFEFNRGKALAFSRLGVAAVTVVGPPAVFLLLSKFGLTVTLLVLAALLMLVAFALVFAWAPRAPKNDDLIPRAPAGWLSLLARRKVLLLALAAGLNYGPVLALLGNFQPIGVSKGLHPALTVGTISTLGVSAAVGALVCGFLIDRFWAPAVAFAMNMLPAAGCVALAMSDGSPTMVFVCAALVGLGQGAENDLVAFMIARYFGLRNYSAIYGLTIIPMGAFVAVIGSFIGWSFDKFGHYDFGLVLAGISFASAAFCYLAMGRYPDRPLDDIAAGLSESG
ncbi:MFS transporter [soil metagenome]